MGTAKERSPLNTILPSQRVLLPAQRLCGSHNELWQPEWLNTKAITTRSVGEMNSKFAR